MGADPVEGGLKLLHGGISRAVLVCTGVRSVTCSSARVQSLRTSYDLLHLARLPSSDARQFRMVFLKASSVMGRFGAGWDTGISS